MEKGISYSAWHLATKGEIKVKMVSIDDLILKNKIPFPDFIKIDVEGAEIRVLSGAKYLLTNFKPVIFLATHSKKLHQECCKLLSQLGYSVLPIKGKNLQNSDEIIAYKKK